MLIINAAFDFVCPWCYIGKRQLRAALEQFSALQPEMSVEVRWRSVQLLPAIPVVGMPFHEFYVARLGGEDQVRARQAQVNAAASPYGLQFNFAAIERMPNTARAHALFTWFAQHLPAQQEQLLERLMAGYFQNGENLADRETLIRVAADLGADATSVRSVLAEAHPTDFPHSMQVPGGVPYFRFNNRLTLTGAQPVPVLLAAMQEAVSIAPLGSTVQVR